MKNELQEGDVLFQVNTNETDEITTLTDNTRIVGQGDGGDNTDVGWFSLARLKSFINAISLSDIVSSLFSTQGVNGKIAGYELTASDFDNNQNVDNKAFVSKGTLKNLMSNRWAHDFVYRGSSPASGTVAIQMGKRRTFAYVPTSSNITINLTIDNNGDNRVLVENESSSGIKVDFYINGSTPTNSESLDVIAAKTSELYEIIYIDKFKTVIQHGPM